MYKQENVGACLRTFSLVLYSMGYNYMCIVLGKRHAKSNDQAI